MSRCLVLILATLTAIAFLGAAPLKAQPAEKPPAQKQAAPATKRSDSEKKDESSQKPAEAKKPGAKRPDGKRADDKKPAPDKSEGRKPAEKKPEEMKPDREALAKAFAEEHHPELASLLKTLEAMNPQAYEVAVRDVSRAALRLNELKERDEERYERELDVWKTRSRVHLVSAEHRVSPGPDLEEKLRVLMQDELEAKRKLLAFEREKAEKRLEQLDRELRALDEKGSAMIDRQIERLPKAPVSTKKTKPKS
jgi:hypothetical protein